MKKVYVVLLVSALLALPAISDEPVPASCETECCAAAEECCDVDACPLAPAGGEEHCVIAVNE